MPKAFQRVHVASLCVYESVSVSLCLCVCVCVCVRVAAMFQRIGQEERSRDGSRNLFSEQRFLDLRTHLESLVFAALR